MASVQQREEAPPRAPSRRRVPRSVREILYIIAFWLVYTVGSIVVQGHVDTAYHNAHLVWQFERAVHLPHEASIQGALLMHPWLIRPVNFFYANVHFTSTGIFLFWLYRRRPEHYLWARRVLALLTGLALATYLLFPLAPPRMRPETGTLDLAAIYGPNVYNTTPGHRSIENVYAAMPSAHVGWATFLAIGLIMVTRSRWRWLWLLHPIVTTVVVVATANHYVLDGVVAWFMLLGVLLVFRPPAGGTELPVRRLASLVKRGTVGEVSARPGG